MVFCLFQQFLFGFSMSKDNRSYRFFVYWRMNSSLAWSAYEWWRYWRFSLIFLSSFWGGGKRRRKINKNITNQPNWSSPFPIPRIARYTWNLLAFECFLCCVKDVKLSSAIVIAFTAYACDCVCVFGGV